MWSVGEVAEEPRARAANADDVRESMLLLHWARVVLRKVKGTSRAWERIDIFSTKARPFPGTGQCNEKSRR